MNMAPEISWGSASTKLDELDQRLARVEALLRDVYMLSNRDAFPPELTERLRDFAYTRYRERKSP